MRTVANQKVITINKEKCSRAKGYEYSMTNLRAETQAALRLEAGPFKLWRFLAMNSDGYPFALSSKVAEEMFGIQRKQYNNAIAELVRQGYLVAVREGSNIYNFYEVSALEYVPRKEAESTSIADF